MLALHRIGRRSWPFVTILIGNRQGALENLLHDAAHRNLASAHNLNDEIAHAFPAPPLFNHLTLYREPHVRHHAWLGNPALRKHQACGDFFGRRAQPKSRISHVAAVCRSIHPS